MGFLNIFKQLFGAHGSTQTINNPGPDPYGAAPAATMTPQPSDWFVQHTATLKNQLRPGEKEIVYWDYKNFRMEDVEDVVTHCKCTASVTWAKKGISAEYTHQQGDVPRGGKIYNFFLTVYKRDGKMKVPDGRGNMKWPDDKIQRTLTITGMLLP